MRLRPLLFLLLLALACRETYDVQKDVTLKNTLATIRAAIASYRGEHGSPPPSLEALVPRYLPRIPVDPLTGKADWRVTTEERVQPSADFTTGTAAAASSVVLDVQSAAPGSDRDGVPYASY